MGDPVYLSICGQTYNFLAECKQLVTGKCLIAFELHRLILKPQNITGFGFHRFKCKVNAQETELRGEESLDFEVLYHVKRYVAVTQDGSKRWLSLTGEFYP